MDGPVPLLRPRRLGDIRPGLEGDLRRVQFHVTCSPTHTQGTLDAVQPERAGSGLLATLRKAAAERLEGIAYGGRHILGVGPSNCRIAGDDDIRRVRSSDLNMHPAGICSVIPPLRVPKDDTDDGKQRSELGQSCRLVPDQRCQFVRLRDPVERNLKRKIHGGPGLGVCKDFEAIHVLEQQRRRRIALNQAPTAQIDEQRRQRANIDAEEISDEP